MGIDGVILTIWLIGSLATFVFGFLMMQKYRDEITLSHILVLLVISGAGPMGLILLFTQWVIAHGSEIIIWKRRVNENE